CQLGGLADSSEGAGAHVITTVMCATACERDQSNDEAYDDDPDHPSSSHSVPPSRTVRPPQRGSRTIGHVIQCPPPRPLPSSNPSISITSTPASRIFEIVYVLRSYATTTPGSRATTLFPSSHCSLSCW